LSSINGVCLIVTTNHINDIDEAMGVIAKDMGTISTRPGRIDAVLEVSFMDEKNRYKMANRILQDWPEIIEEVVHKYAQDVTPAQMQEICIQAAFEQMKKESNQSKFEIGDATEFFPLPEIIDDGDDNPDEDGSFQMESAAMSLKGI
jgi:SpoVK/Ycf46/Vps4 family AAA+-type ATPase